MSEPLLIWLFAGAFGGIIGLAIWVYHHSRNCHGRPSAQEQAVAEERARAEGAAAETLKRLDREVGHQSIEGSILERMHRHSGDLRAVRQHLGMSDQP